MTDSLYREEILEHYQNPHNFGKMEGADGHSRQTNPLCGDDIEMFLRLRSGQGVNGVIIKDVRFFGGGCAICMAGASMLTDYVLGKSREQLTKFSQQDMLELVGVELSETRRKCAFLGWAVLQDCLG